MGGTNSAQNYEFVLQKKGVKPRKFMHTCRAYFADAQRSDRYIYAIGGRGNQALVEFEQFKKSQRTMERYDIERDRWLELSTELNEGRYHATACVLENRYIYIFGGFKTSRFLKSNITRVNKKVETIVNVSSNFIELYDTNFDLEDETFAKLSKIQSQRYKFIGLQFGNLAEQANYSSSSDYESAAHPKNTRRYFQRIHIKRDNVNNVGDLVCFPLYFKGPGQMENQILIAGGLNLGLLSSKSHVYHADSRKVNFRGELQMPIPDVPKFFYRFRETKVLVVGHYRVQEFDLLSETWKVKSFGTQQISKAWLKLQSANTVP
mmetsp:Transcript_5568/g.9556  ORF Transcript_5568/g.9556 Transcript_5568/m.9556 type:complete len:320 (-) Transcript_5568:157-1116(-)